MILALEDYKDSYEYFLINEACNAKQTFLEMKNVLDSLDDSCLNESDIIALQESAIDTIKNFIITIGKKVAQAIEKFIDRVTEITGIDREWLNKNQGIIRSDRNISGSTISDYYPYKNIDQVINTPIIDDCNQSILEQNKDRWENEEGYIGTNPDIGIVGFHYDSQTDTPLQKQIETFLRGEKIDKLDSSNLNQETRTKFLEYCLGTFPAAKTTINAEKDKLKQIANMLDTYLASKSSQINQTIQPSQVANTQTQTTTNTTVTSNVASGSAVQNATGNTTPVNAAFDNFFNDTFFLEVDIKDNNTTGEKQNTTNSVDFKSTSNNVNDVKKNATNEIADMSKAIKTYFRVNTKKISAKMNICVEAYRNRMKLLKWYVSAYSKSENNDKQKSQLQQKQQEPKQQTIGNLSDAFD